MPTRVAVVVPFRDRGADPFRVANLARVEAHWLDSGIPVHVVGDGLGDTAQFNRHAAYNRGRQIAGDPDVIVYAESDMLIDYPQVWEAIRLASEAPRLVVPFTSYRYLSYADSAKVRAGSAPDVFAPESVRDNGEAVGAISVVSRATLDMAGQWDESFAGNWYDDTAMARAFEVAAGPTRWVNGPAWHLYHLPGWEGNHLTAEDRAATAANRMRCRRYMAAATADEIRALTCG